MINLKLEAPWYTYYKMLNALFEQDDEIIVFPIEEYDDGVCDYAIHIDVRNHEKYVALDRVLPAYKAFGSIVVRILLYDVENNSTDPGVELYSTIFKDNPIVKDIRTCVDGLNVVHSYVEFVPEVIQFFDDDISDYNGNWNGLAEDIAREVFENDGSGMNFCTAAKEALE